MEKKKAGLKKGQTNSGSFRTGNQAARAAALPPEIKEIRVATKAQLFQAFKKFMESRAAEFQAVNLDDLSMLDKGVLKSLIKFSESGDYDTIRYILDQIIGKAKESVELSGPEDDKIKIKVTIENAD